MVQAGKVQKSRIQIVRHLVSDRYIYLEYYQSNSEFPSYQLTIDTHDGETIAIQKRHKSNCLHIIVYDNDRIKFATHSNYVVIDTENNSLRSIFIDDNIPILINNIKQLQLFFNTSDLQEEIDQM